MEAKGPLAGKRIVITRAAGQSEGLRIMLRTAGAQVIELPCVEFREVSDADPLDQVIRSLNQFDWLFFTSQNAVRFFARRMRTLNLAPAPPGSRHHRVAAIGPATAEAAANEGFSVDFVPPAGTGRTFAANFKDCVRSVAGMEARNPAVEFVQGLAGMKILVPRSDLALRERAAADWMEVLEEAGAKVTPVVAYRTSMPESLAGPAMNGILQNGADCFIFASPSAFQNFAKAIDSEALRQFGTKSAFAAIGPTTAAAIRVSGLPCAIEATESNSNALIDAIAEYFRRSTRSANSQGAKYA
ncbi:MAG TPA: uroporphyrinogen-III synthase [Candidatus Acidoferrales bacterium]|nr:uroporphyrinogen-III synthase [Candidatus Acidoferrales bacterium]